MDIKDKKNKDRFSVTLIGVVIYSIVLIGVMGGTYVGVKAIFRKQEVNQVASAIEDEEVAEPEEIVEEEPKEEAPSADVEETIESVEAEEEDTALNEHEDDISKAYDEETGSVDYSKIIFKPAKRDTELIWKDTVFARIENVENPADAIVNTYDIKRVKATLVDNKAVQYITYTNPENGLVEKITELEDCGDGFETLDYYFDKGNINYIAQYKAVIDSPISLASSKIGSRFYFRDDVMVRFIYCENDKATAYTLADIDSYSKGTIEQYDYLEKSMLNRAYIVYNLAKELEETQTIYGYIMDEYSVPLEDAQIDIINEADGTSIAYEQTDGDGYYQIEIPCTDDATYVARIKKDSFNNVEVYGIKAMSGAYKYSIDPIYMAYSNAGVVYNVQILVRDATDSTKALSGAIIKLRRGLYNTDGDVIAKGVLDDTGLATVPMVAGSYTAEVSKGGYETALFPVVVKADHQATIGFAVPDVPEDTYRVVVSWDNALLDVDSKVISSGQQRVIKSAADSVGSIMAEVVTIDNVGTDDYKMYVSDYGSIATGNALSYNLTGSNTLVAVYDSSGYVESFHVPVASAGVVWQPFEIRNKKIYPINNYYYGIENIPLWTAK